MNAEMEKRAEEIGFKCMPFLEGEDSEIKVYRNMVVTGARLALESAEKEREELKKGVLTLIDRGAPEGPVYCQDPKCILSAIEEFLKSLQP